MIRVLLTGSIYPRAFLLAAVTEEFSTIEKKEFKNLPLFCYFAETAMLAELRHNRRETCGKMNEKERWYFCFVSVV